METYDELEHEDSLASNFRAEDLSRSDLEQLTVLSFREREIVKALESGGQRLLIGPRGSGKSTYLKSAYFGAIEGDRAFPVYVNYSKSISLEPTFKTSATALPLFRQWVLAQIVVGALSTFSDLGLEAPDLDEDYGRQAAAVVSAIERRQVDEAPETRLDLTGVLEFLERCADLTSRRRVVLLLDDAAHAFAAEQQREFFEIFSGLRSRVVSSKAAVYPGVTSYTPRFHVGHDAQLIDVWLRPDDVQYLDLMKEIAQKRLPHDVFADLEQRDGLLDFIALASFGLPRAMLSMLAQVVEKKRNSTPTSTLTFTSTAVSETAHNALKVFTSLESKLPRYKNFVQVGRELVDACVNAIREYNEQRNPDTDERAIRILLQEPLGPEVERVLGFLEYAGVVRQQLTRISNGERSFKVIVPHYALLLDGNALALGRNPSTANAVESLLSRQHTVRVRRQVTTLLGPDYLERCRLDLGACPACGFERENPEARFCSNCGASLPQVSVYEELLRQSVEALPLSEAISQRLISGGELLTVNDIILDEDSQKLLGTNYIGPVRAVAIKALAEEFVYE
ncbi:MULTISPECIES: hypothetical protein [unclassified Frigoribacterium]|uniref:hypothetical protein n=1 Tax=unclassified Frigoribacterium TaxID=2627005 RepID=UPI000B317C67|nr:MULTISPECIES: hypothetical protein [unclassified Frigoribacterium]